MERSGKKAARINVYFFIQKKIARKKNGDDKKNIRNVIGIFLMPFNEKGFYGYSADRGALCLLRL